MRLCCPMSRLVHRYHLGLALRFTPLHVCGDSRPGVVPTGLAPTQLIVSRRMRIPDSGRRPHAFVFGLLHRLLVCFFLARLESSRRIHLIGFRGYLDFFTHPIVLGFYARVFLCPTILPMLVHFALSPGTGRGRARSHRLHGTLPVRARSVRLRTLDRCRP